MFVRGAPAPFPAAAPAPFRAVDADAARTVPAAATAAAAVRAVLLFRLDFVFAPPPPRCCDVTVDSVLVRLLPRPERSL